MTESAFPHQPPASQKLEDLACAYWSSDTLFAALELKLFESLGNKTLPLPELARIAHCHITPLARLLATLAKFNLVLEIKAGWKNHPDSIRHLIPGEPEYLGDFLLYRRYLQPPWQALTERISNRALPPSLTRDDDYPTRTRHYVRALDQLARLKAKEIVAQLSRFPWHGPVLDVGGGAGAFSRALIRDGRRQRSVHATLFDLPEVLAAAQELYPCADDWRDISPLPGEFLSHTFADSEQFGVIVFANFLHIYHETDAKLCLAKAVTQLTATGHLLVHDYFPDRGGIKGPLYDLNMLANTPNGQCHGAGNLITWLASAGLSEAQVVDLPSDSTLIIARRPPC